MQTIVYILLLLLGVVLMVIAVRSLKNLRRNYQQWQFIQIQSNLFDHHLHLKQHQRCHGERQRHHGYGECSCSRHGHHYRQDDLQQQYLHRNMRHYR